MAAVGGELAKIEGEKGKPATKVDFEVVGSGSPVRTKHAVVGREHVRWLELSVLAWSRDERERRIMARAEVKQGGCCCWG